MIGYTASEEQVKQVLAAALSVSEADVHVGDVDAAIKRMVGSTQIPKSVLLDFTIANHLARAEVFDGPAWEYQISGVVIFKIFPATVDTTTREIVEALINAYGVGKRLAGNTASLVRVTQVERYRDSEFSGLLYRWVPFMVTVWEK